MTIGEKIKRLRKEQDLTQEELGEKIGVKKAAINKYETGTVVNLKRSVIAKLATALDVNPVWLLDDTQGWPPIQKYAPDDHDEDLDTVLEELRDDQKILFRTIKGATPAAVRAAMAVLKSMEETNDEF